MMSFLTSFVRPLAYASLPYLILQTASNSTTMPPRVRYVARVTLYLGALALVSVCSFFLAIGLNLIGRRFDTNYYVGKMFYAWGGGVVNVQIDLEGEEILEESKKNAGIWMINHQSILDVLVMSKLMPKNIAVMAKKSLKYTPLGPFMTLAGAIFVDRSNNAKSIQSLRSAGQMMQSRKVSMLMFPEGTRTSAPIPGMLPLKKGGFHLAIQSGLPIVPIVAENYWRIYRKGWFGEGRFRVRVLPAIPTTGMTAADVPALATLVRERMLEALLDMASTAPSQDEKSTASGSVEEVQADEEEEWREKTVGPTDHDQQQQQQGPLETSVSSASLSSSSTSSLTRQWKLEGAGSENGGETTEEDEGMVLVGGVKK